MYTRVKTEKEIEAMRQAGKILAQVLTALKSEVAVGVSTKDLADLARSEIKRLGGEPSFLGYQGFPDVICISLNDEVVHGIPSKNRTIEDGDLVSLDLGVTYGGMIVDSAITVVAGTSDKQKDTLLRTTEESLQASLKHIRAGAHVGDISEAVQVVLSRGGYGIVRELVGHGVGHEIHEDPNIPNYGRKGSGPKLTAGMTIAVEPMATTGSEDIYIEKDGWTVRTKDHSLACHFEHTILVTKSGCEVLTLR